MLSDYYKAVQLLSNEDVFFFPAALLRLLQSRLKAGIGPRFYMLFQFDEVPLRFWPNYLLDEELRPILRNVNNELDRRVVGSKVLFYEHCLKTHIETVPILEKFQIDERGEVHHNSYKATCDSWDKKNTSTLGDAFFCKPIEGSWGQGSFKFQKLNGQWISENKPIDLRSFCSKSTAGASSEWIVQPLISIHRKLTEVTSPQGLSTVRVISVLDKSKVTLLVAMLRITVGDNVIDNFSAGQTGNLVAPIHLETGQLGQCKGSVSKEFPLIAVFDQHPDTGNPVAGFTMPFWEDLKGLVIRAHQSLPQLVALAWDVAVTDEGPVIIEANPTFDVSGMQVAHGKGLRPLLLGHLKRLRPEVF